MKKNHLRLGFNIDHVATLRNARGSEHPSPLRAALMAVEAGVDSITVHLREDRRHIRDQDVVDLKKYLTVPINLEMAVTDEMIGIAEQIRPHAICLVPEKRHEITTEGGLDVVAQAESIAAAVKRLSAAGCRVSLFIDPDPEQIVAAHQVGAPVVELHTGNYANNANDPAMIERLAAAAQLGDSLGLEIHAGHGLTPANVGPVAAIPFIKELNIGHYLVGEALFYGIGYVLGDMRLAMDLARR
jgi:pyridoxine 5-phosphate synthase